MLSVNNIIMKRFYSIGLVVALISMTSCSSDTIDEEYGFSDSITSQQESPMLSFVDESDFRQTLLILENMSISERRQWVLAHKGYIKSLQDIYDEAMYDADDIDETAESYLNYKEKYENYLFFSTYKDDCGAYLPVSNAAMASLLNTNGEVMIGGEIKDMRDIHSYQQLQDIGVAMYEYPETRASAHWNNIHNSHDITFYETSNGYEKNVGDEFDTRWWETSKRKIRFKCGRKAKLEVSATRLLIIRLHIEISFRKKTVFGWANYSSRTETDATFSGGLSGTYHWYKEADSSHDFYIPLIPSIDTNSGYVRYQNPSISGKVTISFRGIDYLDPIFFTIAALDLDAGIPNYS